MRKKVKKIFLIICMLFMLIPRAYAANVEKIADIENAPLINGRKPIYIVNVKDVSITINDTDNFTLSGDGKTVNTPMKSKKDITYSNPFEFNIKNIGYYIDDNGSPVYLNAKLKILEMSFLKDQSSAWITRVAYVDRYGIWIEDGNEGPYRGIHATIQFIFYDSNNNVLSENEFNKMYVQWKFKDIDVTTAPDPNYYESVMFQSGFGDTFYVRENTYLAISENNTRYTATKSTNHTSASSVAYSTVVGYQLMNNATIKWWGYGCGTNVLPVVTNVPYPEISNPVKKADKSLYVINETVTYTVEQTFPLSDSTNAPKSIVLEDVFDDALDITKISVKVLNNDGTDVTSEWTKAVNKQKLTLTSNVKDKSTVKGKYQFVFSNVKIKLPSSSHETIVENNTTYRLIPNKTTLKITKQDDTETTKESNEVKIKVKTSSIQLVKDVASTVGENPQAGDIIKYKFTITNNGPVELSNITLTDIMTDIVFDDKIKSKLAPGETIEVHGHYVLKSADISNKNVLKNTATVTGTTPDGEKVSDTDDEIVELVVLENPKTGLKISLLVISLIISLIAIFVAYKKGFKLEKNNTTNNE